MEPHDDGKRMRCHSGWVKLQLTANSTGFIEEQEEQEEERNEEKIINEGPLF